MLERGRLGISAIGALCLLALLGPSRAGGDAPQIYSHVPQDRQAILVDLGTRSASYASVLCILDAATFNPPPGDSEFTADHRYRDDLASWLESVKTLAGKTKCPTYVAATSSAHVVRAEGDGWQTQVERDLAPEWWEASSPFVPAAKSLARLVDEAHGHCMVVLVTGDILPEATVQGTFASPVFPEDDAAAEAKETWRSKLLPVGEYWDEEKVANALRERSSGLFVVAPEARFCDFLPVVEIPDLPWVSRPVMPPFDALAEKMNEEQRARTEEALKGLSPEQREKILRALETQVSESGGNTRFESSTPAFCEHYGRGVFFNTDCPSGFGYWPFARVAAATGGRYLFYPFPPGRWLDKCTRDLALMNRLAPELGPRSEYLEAKRNDPALDAICDACRQVIEETPWTDSHDLDLHNRAPGWMLFRSTKPLVLFDRFPRRDRPCDESYDSGFFEDPPPSRLRKYAQRLSRAAKGYDRAIAILERAAKSMEGGPGGAHPRSVADLYLARFWFEMSAFHLEAMSLFFKERARLRERDKVHGRFTVTYVPTIRMSDCLDSESGLTVSPNDEGSYRSDFAPKGYQGNLLGVPQGNPKFRARRDIEMVLKNLDPSLKDRALRMIHAADDVIARYRKSPWGWVVYYTEAFTFVSVEVTGSPVESDRMGVEILRPTTPHPPPSTGGGPTTGGG